MEIIRSTLFARFPQLVFGLSTKNGGVSTPPYDLNLSVSVGDDPENVRENRKRFFRTLYIDTSRLAFPLQVHSSHVQYADAPGRYPRTDGLSTDLTELYLIITIADCLPVFMYDPERNVIAGIHAGWKGSSQDITGKMIQFMIDRWQVNPANLLAFLGPSAGVCCYEVGEEVATQFDDEFVHPKKNGKFLLDIPVVNKTQLLAAGVRSSNIEHLNECTICTPNRYHSYRRDGKKSGRMMGVLGIK